MILKLTLLLLAIIYLSCSNYNANKSLIDQVEIKPEIEAYSDIKSSIRSYTILIKEDRYNYKLFVQRGKLYFELSEKSNWLYYQKRGIDDFDEAIKLKPKSPWVYKIRAEKLSILEKETEALEDYNKYIKMVPDDLDALQKRKALLLEIGDTVQVYKEIAKVKELKKRNLKFYEKRYNTRFPKTLDEAVKYLIATLDQDVKDIYKRTQRHNLVNYHFSLGMYIRNQFGLWAGNYDLLKSCGSEDMHPDDASMIIIQELWKRLQCY